jgi:hypothetical protein
MDYLKVFFLEVSDCLRSVDCGVVVHSIIVFFKSHLSLVETISLS